MKITGAGSFLLNVPIGKNIADSMQSVTHLEFVGLTIDTDEGIKGTGYTVTVGHGGSVIQNAIDISPGGCGRGHIVKDASG